jgi:transcriptional regulator with XRE-family HTH domain
MTSELDAIPGIGSRLRAARERLGWSREALAFHAGVSWSAIAQVEAGRRTNVRPSTLAALSRPLGVTIDYLVSGGSVAPNMLEHRAFLYSTDEQYQQVMGAFLRDGLEREEAALAVTTKHNIGLLGKELGDDARKVEFVESKKWLTTPANAHEHFRSFCGTRLAGGAAWVRFIAEPIWKGRSDDEVLLWTRFESLLDVLLAHSAATLVCPYDERVVNSEILGKVSHTHPHMVTESGLEESPEYRGPGHLALEP